MNPSILQHRFGVNYVPTREWYHFWNDFEPDSVARDLDAIAALNLDHIRLQTIWPWFQPNPTHVSDAHLERLRQVVALAGERGLDVWVTALTGWLSGYAFSPPYIKLDRFYEEDSWAPEALYLDALTRTLQDLPNFAGIDLGNELNCAWRASTDRGDAWMSRALKACREGAPGRVHVNGVDHQPWFRPDTFSPAALVNQQEIVSIHAWTYFTGALQVAGPLGAPSTHLLRTLAALARAQSGAIDKPVWIQEFGASRTWMSEGEVSKFMATSIEQGVKGGVSWFTWWCSHDIDRRFKFDELEYGLGLMDLENRPKAEALVFRDFARELAGKDVTVPTNVPEPPDHEAASVLSWLSELARS